MMMMCSFESQNGCLNDNKLQLYVPVAQVWDVAVGMQGSSLW